MTMLHSVIQLRLIMLLLVQKKNRKLASVSSTAFILFQIFKSQFYCKCRQAEVQVNNLKPCKDGSEILKSSYTGDKDSEVICQYVNSFEIFLSEKMTNGAKSVAEEKTTSQNDLSIEILF